MKKAFLSLGLGLGLAGCIVIDDRNVTVPSNTPPAEISVSHPVHPIVRGARSGERQTLVSFYAIAPDCTPLGYPTLTVAKAPAHGQVSIEEGSAIAGFGAGDVRTSCNGRTVPATVIYYTSDSGFIGDDSVAFDRVGVAGAYGYHDYTIKVR